MSLGMYMDFWKTYNHGSLVLSLLFYFSAPHRLIAWQLLKIPQGLLCEPDVNFHIYNHHP